MYKHPEAKPHWPTYISLHMTSLTYLHILLHDLIDLLTSHYTWPHWPMYIAYYTTSLTYLHLFRPTEQMGRFLRFWDGGVRRCISVGCWSRCHGSWLRAWPLGCRLRDGCCRYGDCGTLLTDRAMLLCQSHLQMVNWRIQFNIHPFVPDISIAPLQVHYYTEVLPTTALILCKS